MNQLLCKRRAAWSGKPPLQHPRSGFRKARLSCRFYTAFQAAINDREAPSAQQPSHQANPVENMKGDSSGGTSSTAAYAVPSSVNSSGWVAASPPASASDLNRSLLAALAAQFQRESLPWIQDLVVPLFEGPPQPLTGTMPPEQLADHDSRFISVHGVRIHYKMALPGERESSIPAAAAAAGRRTQAAVSNAAALTTTAAPAAATTAFSGPLTGSVTTRSTSSLPPSMWSFLDERRSSSSASLSSSPSSTPPAQAPPPPPPPSSSTSSSSSPPTATSTDSTLNPDAAPTLLLMHGLNGSTFNWRLLMDDFAAYVSPSTGGCRVVAYDRPPYGLSQRPLSWQREEDNPCTLAGGAKLAAGLLDAVLGPVQPLTQPPPGRTAVTGGTAASGSAAGGVQPVAPRLGSRAVLVGHSAGAAVAVETALRYPERVCGLVLIAPAISTNSRGFLAQADLGQLLRFAWTRALLSADGPGLNYVRRQVMKRKAEVQTGRLGMYVDEREVPQEVIDGYLRPLRAQDWDKGILLVYRSLQVSGVPPPLEQLRVPVLVLQGRDDRTVPLETARALAEALRGREGAVTEMVVLERCAHVPMDEQPLEVLATVVDFVNRNCCGNQWLQEQQQQGGRGP